MAEYDINDTVRVTNTFKNLAGTATDPSAVTAVVTDPAGTATTYTYPADAQIVKTGTGVYYIDVTLTSSGTWVVRWRGTGAVATQEETFLSVRPNYAADTLNVITLAEAKHSINFTVSATDDQHDDELLRFITAVSRRLDELCGPIVKRTVTDEAHSGGSGMIFLHKHPVASVTTVKEYAGTTLTTLTAETVASQIANQYQYDTRLGILYRRSSGSDYNFYTGRANVLVTYVAGRYDNTAAVDGKFKTAAGLILQELWGPSASRWSRPPGSFQDDVPVGMMPWAALPKPARDLLGDELRAPAVA